MKKLETFELVMNEGASKFYYTTKEELLDCISVRDFRNGKYIRIVNKGNDKVNHRIINLEDLK